MEKVGFLLLTVGFCGVGYGLYLIWKAKNRDNQENHVNIGIIAQNTTIHKLNELYEDVEKAEDIEKQ